MKTKNMIQLTMVIVMCLLSFTFGKLLSSKNVVTYQVKGIPTSFNRAWPTYGLPLGNYESTLMLLQSGHAKESIPFLEAYLDAAVYDAECRRPLLRGDDRKDLDKALTKVALYREKYPRPLTDSTDRLDQVWIAWQKNVDAFLGSYVNTNSIKTHPQ